jgi:APA family basic amino acid/polyamine antiporter
MATARTPYAVARDGLFFARFGRAHPSFYTPDAALLFQGILASALVMLGGSYQQLFSLEVFSSFLTYLLSGVALFVLRTREPDAHLPFRAWGYPFTPAIFVFAAGCMVYVIFVDNLRNSFIGVAIILLGLPVYAFFARGKEIGHLYP